MREAKLSAAPLHSFCGLVHISEEEMLAQINTYPPFLLERAKVQALFYMAIKAFEANDFDRYAEHLKNACDLYKSAPIVTLEFEYHLAEIYFSKI